MKGRLISCWCRSAIVAALLPSAMAAPKTGADFAAWPKNWSDSYLRFEKFIADQSRYNPPSGLQIQADGGIQTGISTFEDRDHHSGIVFYKDGSQILDMGMSGSLFSDGRDDIFLSGTYAACVNNAGLLGYQFIHPLVWFTVSRPETNARSRADGAQVRMIDGPQPPADFWPNERLLRYCDFQVFPHTNPLDFFEKNNKVSPNVILGVTRTGTIERKALDAPLEKLLRWRIYQDGRLIEKGPAGGDLHHPAGKKAGSYVVFVGVDGPDGFMPVSNFLQFPLFPEKDGSMAVLPSVTNKIGFPDFLLEVLAPSQVDDLRTAESWTGSGGDYNNVTIYGLNPAARVDDPKKQALLSLWCHWSWEVREAKSNPDSDINRIHLAPEATPVPAHP